MKCLLGEANADEQEEANRWLAEDDENQAYFAQLKTIWDDSRQLAANTVIDENKAWSRFQQRIHQPAVRSRFGWMRIAASIIVIVGAGLLFFFLRNSSVKEMTVTAQNGVLNEFLPDGSSVTINKGSSVVYPSKFKGDTRPITLNGEAFFNVQPDKEKPFVISVNDLQITVVGTSFNVKAINGNTEVIVETGIVRVTRAGKTVELRANEKLVAEQEDSALIKENVDEQLYKYYRTKEFVCDDTPLWKLVQVINEAYQSNIVIGNPALKDMPITTTFYNESLEQVLNVISITFNIKVAREGDKIILQ